MWTSGFSLCPYNSMINNQSKNDIHCTYNDSTYRSFGFNIANYTNFKAEMHQNYVHVTKSKYMYSFVCSSEQCAVPVYFDIRRSLLSNKLIKFTRCLFLCKIQSLIKKKSTKNKCVVPRVCTCGCCYMYVTVLHLHVGKIQGRKPVLITWDEFMLYR